nr:spore coat protein GerQ [Paenibacillus sp. 481]
MQPVAPAPAPAVQPVSSVPSGAPVVPPQVPSGSVMTPTGAVLPNVGFEQSYVENILRLNLGKVGTFYMTYENNSEWNAKVFRGVLEAAGRDHIIISDPLTGQRVLLLMVNLDYATFDEPLNYHYPLSGSPARSATECLNS